MSIERNQRRVTPSRDFGVGLLQRQGWCQNLGWIFSRKIENMLGLRYGEKKSWLSFSARKGSR